MLDAEQQRALRTCKLPAVLEAGEAVFHHPLVMHGSYANTSASQRRATVLNVMQKGVVSNCQGHDMGNFPCVADGREMGSHGCYPPLVSLHEVAMMEEAAGGVCNAAPPLDIEGSMREVAAMRERQAQIRYRHKS